MSVPSLNPDAESSKGPSIFHLVAEIGVRGNDDHRKRLYDYWRRYPLLLELGISGGCHMR